MDIQEAMDLARSETEILRARKNILFTFGPTKLPYICLSDNGDGGVNVRHGEVTADKPAIAVPGREFGFEGFEIEGMADDAAVPVLIARGIHMPPLKYVNNSGKSRIVRGELRSVVDAELEALEDADDTKTGVIIAPDQVWKISILLYVGSQVARSAESNVHEHMERLRLQQRRD